MSRVTDATDLAHICISSSMCKGEITLFVPFMFHPKRPPTQWKWSRHERSMSTKNVYNAVVMDTIRKRVGTQDHWLNHDNDNKFLIWSDHKTTMYNDIYMSSTMNREDIWAHDDISHDIHTRSNIVDQLVNVLNTKQNMAFIWWDFDQDDLMVGIMITNSRFT